MEDSVTFSTDSEDSILASSKLDSKDLSFASPTIVSKLNSLSKFKYSAGGGHDKLAELFRKDLISAMKLADTESLQPEDYHLISDPWRQDWERGVQVPINPDDVKESSVVVIKENEMLHGSYAFKLPKKYLHATQDETYKQGMHELHGMQALADEVCRYDLDDFDSVWLKLYNELRGRCGEEPLDEWVMERVMEQLETQCYDGMQEAMKTVEGLGIEYDEDVVCDVCRSPEVEEGNEMVFCDGCDICVHQACYGIVKIPKGNWLCKTCVLNVKPNCVLCPNVGGAMKTTEDGLRWAHLSCAIWIPEVTIGCSDKMQPIKDIDEIPATRWALICTLCRERTGACIQCCVKTCKTAFHVTCAFQHNLEMKVNLEDDNNDVQLKGYCPTHSIKHDSDRSPRKTPTSTPKKTLEMTEEERTAERSRRLQKLAEEFYNYVDLRKVADAVKTDKRTVDLIHCYWLLKRKCNFNKALLTPKVEEGDLLLKQREDTMVARLKMFIHLRQDLERVRNLCYMVTKREKLRTQLHRVKMQLFLQQSKILRKEKLRPNGREYKSISTAHKQTMSIYDQPEEVMKTSKYFESFTDFNEMKSDMKTPGKIQRLAAVIGTPGILQKLTPVKSKPKPKTPTENPYAKPTYKSFAWMLSARRRSQGSTSASPEKQVEESLEQAGWQQKKRRGRRPKSTICLDKRDAEIRKTDNENANVSVCDVNGDISGSCFQKCSIKPDISMDTHASTKQKTYSTGIYTCETYVPTKQKTCTLKINDNTHPNGNSAAAAAKINMKEEPTSEEIVAEQPVMPQKRRRGRPPKVRIRENDDSSTFCQATKKEDKNCAAKKVNCSIEHNHDTLACTRQESQGTGQNCHKKETGDCMLEGIKVLEDSAQNKAGFFGASSKDEQERNQNFERNCDCKVELNAELLQNDLKSGSDKIEEDAEWFGICNDLKPHLSSVPQLLESRDLGLYRSNASPDGSHNWSLDPSLLDGRPTSPGSERLLKTPELGKCCTENQSETLTNDSSVEETDKAMCVPRISKIEDFEISTELTKRLLDQKKCVALKSTWQNGKRSSVSSVKKRKSSQLFGRKDCTSDEADDQQRSRPALHLKENGLLKNQPMDRFFPKPEPEKVDGVVKRNGSLYEKQQVCDEVGANNRTEKIEVMDYLKGELSPSHSSPSSNADSDLSNPSQGLCSHTTVSPLNLPSRKRNKVYSKSNLHSKKRLRYAKGGKESVPPGVTGNGIDSKECSDTTKLKDLDSKMTNGFSPVNRRYRTRQSLSSS